MGLRNRIVHGYFGVDVDIIWQIVQTDVSPLREAIAGVLCKTDPVD